MAYTFQYVLQGDFVGKTREGEVSFTVEKSFGATINTANHSYATGAVISSDINGDSVPDTVYQALESRVQEFCVRYSVDINTVKMTRANLMVPDEHSRANIYFNPSNPSTQTTDINAIAYGYLIDNSLISPPTNVTTVSGDTFITVVWEHTGHALGFRIFNEQGELLATIGTGPNEWMHKELPPNTEVLYRVAAYNENGQSEFAQAVGSTLSVYSEYPDRADTEPVVVDYDRPSPVVDQETTSLYAFQSGVGDNLDLLVKKDKEFTTRELVSYEMQIKGYEAKEIHVFELKEFRYRFKYNSTVTRWYDGRIDGDGVLNTDGAGKKDLVVPMELSSTATVELNDPSGAIRQTVSSGEVTFSSNLASATRREIQVAHYGPKVKGKGIFTVVGNEIIRIEEEIPSPFYDSVFYDNQGNKLSIVDWDIVVYTENPNVRVWLSKEPTNYWFQKKFMPIELKAQIINLTQTPWTPMIHNGYYYLHQSERFLYGASEVQGWQEKARSYIPLNFGYTINTYATRNIPGSLQEFSDDAKKDFSGSLTNVTLELVEGSLALVDKEKNGTYISGIKSFFNPAKSYEPITWNAGEPYGSKVRVYTQSKLRSGAWSPWTEVINGGAINSPLSKEIRYKAELIPGEKKNTTTTEYTDSTQGEFTLGYYQNESKQTLISNVEINNDLVLVKDPLVANGVYTSSTFEMGEDVDDLGTITFRGFYEDGTELGENVQLYTASSDIDTGWEDATWLPLLNPIKEDAKYTAIVDGRTVYAVQWKGTVQSDSKRFARYQVRFTSGQKEEVIQHSIVNRDFEKGTHDNTMMLNSILRLRDTTKSGIYVTPTMDMQTAHTILRSYTGAAHSYTMPYNGGSVKIYTFASADSSEVDSITDNDPRWAESVNSVESGNYRYIKLKVEMTPGVTADGNSETPLLHGMRIDTLVLLHTRPALGLVYLKANTYYTTKETPMLHNIRIAGVYENIITNEVYTSTFDTEVLSDKELYRISEETIQSLVDKDLQTKAVNREYLTLNRYEIKTEMPGVILTSRDKDDPSIVIDDWEIQKGYLYAQTTDIAQDYVFEQIYINVEDDNTAIVSPIPQQGCPVVIRDHSGTEMIGVPFANEDGHPTLDYVEEMITDGRDMIVLTYANLDIDTLKLEVYRDKEQVWQEIVYTHADHHFITLDEFYPAKTRIRATYRILNSYCIDYDYDVREDFAKIYMHKPVLDDSRKVKVWYETSKDTAYYIAKEIDLNPLKNIRNAGFIYLTDKVEPAYSMELNLPTSVMYATGKDTIYITAKVLDKLGNPVVGELVEFSAEEGSVLITQSKTDMNGMAVARYIAGTLPGTISITATNRAAHLEVSKEIQVIKEALPARLSVEASSYSIASGENVILRAFVTGVNQESASYEEVVFTPDSGTAKKDNTDYHGEASVTYAFTESGVRQVVVTVPSLGLSETILLHVKGA